MTSLKRSNCLTQRIGVCQTYKTTNTGSGDVFLFVMICSGTSFVAERLSSFRGSEYIKTMEKVIFETFKKIEKKVGMEYQKEYK